MGASLERIVRPRIPPRIRPVAAKDAFSSEDDDTGVARITGSGGGVVNLSHSFQSTQSRKTHSEIRRKFDLVRVKNPDDTSQHVDVEVTHKIKARDSLGLTNKYNYAKPPASENVEILQEDEERDSNIPVN